VIGIALIVDDSFDASIDQHLRADDAGVVGAVECGSSDRHSVISGLNDGVLLPVKTTTEFMSLTRGDGLLLTKATDFETVLESSGSAIVTRSQDLLILNEKGPHLSPETRRTFSHQVGNIHKVLFPTWPSVESCGRTPVYRKKVWFMQALPRVDVSRLASGQAGRAMAHSATGRGL